MILDSKGKKFRERSRIISNNKLELPEELLVAPDLLIEEEKVSKFNVKCSTFVEQAMTIPDFETQRLVNFSLKDSPFWEYIYNCGNPRILLKTGRQTGKSTFVGNRMLYYCCVCPSFHCLYVSPSRIQTRTFVSDRITTTISTSDVLKTFTNSKLLDNSEEKQFINLSKITLRYAFLNADRCRGIARVNCLIIDELQDIIQENIGVIEQTTFAAQKYKYFIYSGTPKTLDNPIEEYWMKASTQNEWAIPCWRHSFFVGGHKQPHWNIIIDDRQIKPKGLSCELCEQLINPLDPKAHWVSLNPSVRKTGLPYEGFHIPQVITKFARWDTVYQDYNTKKRGTFFNETLGISYDSGDKPITKYELLENCVDSPPMYLDEGWLDRTLHPNIGSGQIPLYAGIDWSGGSELSKTVFCIGGYLRDPISHKSYFTIFYFKRFEGTENDPRFQLNFIKDKINKWGVKIIGADYGGGNWPNSELKKIYGVHRVQTYQYAAPKKKAMFQSDLGRWVVHRSEVMGDVFTAMKTGRFFRFPRQEDFLEPYGKDILNISSDINQKGNLIYNRNLAQTDDTFHAILYCFLASYRLEPDLGFGVMRPGMDTRFTDEL